MLDQMTSSRPYLVRALNDWICDNDMTTHIVVDANADKVIVPREFVESGKIVLNISSLAVEGLFIDNNFLSFSARFSGKAMDVCVPISSIMAIYAKENGQGMVFADEPTTTSPSPGSKSPGSKSKGADKPNLRIVK